MRLSLPGPVNREWITIVASAGFAIVLFAASIYFMTSEFPVGTGTSWTYQVYSSSLFQAAPLVYDEVSKVTGLELCGLQVCFVLRTENPNERFTFWVSDHWVLVRSTWESKTSSEALDLSFNPGVRLYERQMEVGSSWKWDTKTQVRSTKGDKVSERLIAITDVERLVTAKELVNVPAGDFEVLLVEQRENGQLARRVWYSNEVGEAVRFEFPGAAPGIRQWGELKSYESRPSSPLQVLDLSLIGIELKYVILLTGALGVVRAARGSKRRSSELPQVAT